MGIADQGRQGREGKGNLGLVRRLRARPASLLLATGRGKGGRDGIGEHEHHGPDYFSCGGRKVSSALTQRPDRAAEKQESGTRAAPAGGWWLEAEVGKLWGSLGLGTHAQPRALRFTRGSLSALPVARQRRRPLFSCSLQSCLLVRGDHGPGKGEGLRGRP